MLSKTTHGASETAADGAFVRSLRGLAPYVVAGVIFVALGVNDPRWMLNWSFSLALLLTIVWALPAMVGKWLR